MTFEVILHKRKIIGFHNDSIHRKFHQNWSINKNAGITKTRRLWKFFCEIKFLIKNL